MSDGKSGLPIADQSIVCVCQSEHSCGFVCELYECHILIVLAEHNSVNVEFGK